MYWFNLLLCLFTFASSAMITGIAAVISSCIVRNHSKRRYYSVWRVIFWGGGLANAAIISGLPVEIAITLIPCTISCIIFPVKRYVDTNDISQILINNLNICVLAIITLLPLMVILWLNHFTWQAILFAAFSLPMIYNLSRFFSANKVWSTRYHYNIIEFSYGVMIGICLCFAVNNRPIFSFPPLPNDIFTISLENHP